MAWNLFYVSNLVIKMSKRLNSEARKDYRRWWLLQQSFRDRDE